MENEENEIFRTFLGEDFFGGLDLGSMGMKMGGKKFKIKTSSTVTKDGKTETKSFTQDSKSNVKISKVNFFNKFVYEVQVIDEFWIV